MRLAPLIVLTIGAVGALPLATCAATIHGYVVDADGHRIQGARVQAWHIVPTDQRPPQRPKRLGETTTGEHGNFTLSVDSRLVNMIIASFNNQSGSALPSFSDIVRVALRHNRPRPGSGVGADERGYAHRNL